MGQGLLWFNQQKNDGSIIRDKEIVENIFQTIFASDVFNKTLAETEAYRLLLETLWQKNRETIEDFEKIIRLDTSREGVVLVLPPTLETGSYLGEGIIEWGNQDIAPHYQLYALCHEYLHLITEDLFQTSNTEEEKWLLHALIYLSADEELRLSLLDDVSDEKQYFVSHLTALYHPRLIKVARSLLDPWKEYMLDTSENFIDLYESLRRKNDP